MKLPRRLLVLGVALGAIALSAVALPASGVGAGVSGGASALYFTQGAPDYSYGLTFTTNAKVTQILEIAWSCRSLKTGENDYATGQLKLRHLKFEGRVSFGHQEYSPKLDGLSPSALVRGYLKVRWASVDGPVTGTISAKGCRNGKPQKVDAFPG